RPVTPGVAGSSPVHSATYIKPQSKDWGFFRFGSPDLPETHFHIETLHLELHYPLHMILISS
ncbi:hypothetical protein, partial [Vibrio alginolyticus]|uniref:hypothetical protein n=1 Tax=Vibrio alginolyticus TaxID=663 RepID=UPI00301C7EB6